MKARESEIVTFEVAGRVFFGGGGLSPLWSVNGANNCARQTEKRRQAGALQNNEPVAISASGLAEYAQKIDCGLFACV